MTPHACAVGSVRTAEAAYRFFPKPDQAVSRRPFLEKVLALLEQEKSPRSGDDSHLKGTLHRALGQKKEAAAAFRGALRTQSRRADWRLELAQVLLEDGQKQEARQELRLLLRQHPGDDAARQLLQVLEDSP